MRMLSQSHDPRMRRVRFTALFLVAIGTACAVNRQAAPASLPVPLVTALIDSRGLPTRSSPDYAVGKLPLAYPPALVPSGPVRIVGGMTTGDEIVAVFADSSRRLATVFEQLFERTGFTRPPSTRGSGFSPGSGPYSFFCGDSGTVSVEPLTGANRDFARVTYRRARGVRSCPTFEPVRPADQLTLPELKPPPGVSVSRTHGGGGSDDVNSTAEMRGVNLVPSVVVAHYAAQLAAAGWTAAAPAVSERVVAQYFEAKDASGGPWEGLLMASGGKTSLTVSLTMHPRVNR